MNDPITEPVTSGAAKCCADIDQRVRQNPGTAMLIAVGAGLAIALIVRALRPEPTPQHRITRMLEDIQRRVRDVAGPAFHKAGELASESAEAVSDGWHTGGARLGRFFRDGRKRLRHLFPRA